MRSAAAADLSIDDTCPGGSLPVELLAEIVGRMPMPTVVDRPSGGVYLNPAARSLWSNTDACSPDLPVIVGGKTHSLSTLHSGPDRGQELTSMPQVRVPGGKEYEVDLFHWRPEADSPPWRVSILRPMDHGKERASLSADDKLLTDKLNRLKAIVHEFRNTLTAAREALAFLQEGAVGEMNTEQHRFLDSAMEDLDGLVRTIVELTSLWATPAGVLRLFTRPVDIRHVVELTTLSTQPIAEKRGISLHVEVGGLPLVLTGDNELLVQGLRNVLTNALRHTPAGGEIWVRAFVIGGDKEGAPKDVRGADPEPGQGREADETVVIEVQDSGKGIAAVDRERIFQPFERGSADGPGEGVAGGGGMGLGLAIARDIASTHGGTLDARSVSGEGACFVFRFPKSQTGARAWMVRATQRAIEDVRPLGVPLACVRLRFEADGDDPEERVRSGLLSAAQQFAIQSLRPADTVLAIEGQLLLLMRGGTQSTAYAMLDRVLHALVKMLRAGGGTSGECNMVFGVAAYPEDGDNAEAILSRAEAELSAFQ